MYWGNQRDWCPKHNLTIDNDDKKPQLDHPSSHDRTYLLDYPIENQPSGKHQRLCKFISNEDIPKTHKQQQTIEQLCNRHWLIRDTSQTYILNQISSSSILIAFFSLFSLSIFHLWTFLYDPFWWWGFFLISFFLLWWLFFLWSSCCSFGYYTLSFDNFYP